MKSKTNFYIAEWGGGGALLNAIGGKSFEKYNMAPLPNDNVNYRNNFKKCSAIDENSHHGKKYSVKEI